MRPAAWSWGQNDAQLPAALKRVSLPTCIPCPQAQAFERKLFTADQQAPPSQLREGRTLLQVGWLRRWGKHGLAGGWETGGTVGRRCEDVCRGRHLTFLSRSPTPVAMPGPDLRRHARARRIRVPCCCRHDGLSRRLHPPADHPASHVSCAGWLRCAAREALRREWRSLEQVAWPPCTLQLLLTALLPRLPGRPTRRGPAPVAPAVPSFQPAMQPSPPL